MQIIEMAVKDLKPYEKNPRLNDDAVKYVAESIRNFGFKVPIVIDKDNNIVCGHTRWKACKKLKIETVPCVVADDLTEEQIRAYRLADNKVGEKAEWDLALLDTELAEIETIDMTLLGFDDKEEETTQEVVEDDFDEEPPAEPKAKYGDLYQLGRHKLLCGDSTKIDDVEKLMDGCKANMVFADPPYGYEYQSNMRTKTEKFNVLKNDNKILDFFPLLKEFNQGFVFICTSWKVLDKWLELFSQYYKLSNMIIWNKGGGGIGDLEHTFLTDYEVILCSNNGAKITGKRIGSVWNIPKDNANDYVHATQKPIRVSATAIENTTNKNQIVLDLFGGSGSTLIACEQTNRRCFMMEISPEYCDVILQRYINFKGSNADVFLLKDGKRIPYSEVV